MRWLFFLYLLAISCLPAFAQAPGGSFLFNHLDISNGLASNHVSAILQDRKGFIWIASTVLQRYDGSNLVTVASFDKVPGSIYYDDICLCEDKRGRIWMGAPDNIRFYDPATAKVTVLMPTVKGSLYCSHLVQDHAGIIWVTTAEGLLQYDEKATRFIKPPFVPEAQRREMFSAIAEDPDGNLWISGRNGIYMLSPDRRQLYHAGNNPRHIPLLDVHSSIKKFYMDQQQRLWAAARMGDTLYAYHLKEHTLNRYVLKDHGAPNMVTDVVSDAEQHIWAATEQAGIYRLDEQTRRFNVNVQKNNADDKSLHYNFEVNCFLNDRDGRLWIGSDQGVNILGFPGPSFRVLDHRTVFSDSARHLPRAEVTGVFQDSRGNIYAGYWGQGFCWLGPDLSLRRQFVHGSHQLPEERGLVWSFAGMKDGQVLIGQENGWLSVFDPRKGEFTAQYHPPVFDDQTLMTMLPESDTAVWIGMYKRGLVRWNPLHKQFYHYSVWPGNEDRPVTVMALARQGDSLLWLATGDAGLIRFNRRQGKASAAYLLKEDKLSISNITRLNFLDDTTLAAGTDHGLWLFNTNTGKARPLLINGALFDEWVLGMREDGAGGLWLTTQAGFYRYKRQTGTLETFVQSGDIIDNDRKVRRSIVRLKDGRLLVGASDHFMVFDPAGLQTAPPPPNVTIIHLRAMDSSVHFSDAHTPVNLSYRQNFISIEFKSLQYHHASIRYLYQLDGVDEGWVNAEGLLTARYTNLSPGHYTFRVRSVNAAGTFSNGITSLEIYIKPAYWQTTWFRLLCLAGVVVLIYLYLSIRISSVRQEARQRAAMQQKIAQLEMNALRAQMNPHFIFNALNSIQTFMMKRETEQALSYLGRFARLIRNVLDNSQLNSIPVSKELKMLENYLELEKLRFTDQFDCSIKVDPELDPDFIDIPTMVLQPFVENAIWHGLLHKKEKGCLKITFHKRQHSVLCIIEDNGIGRERSAALRQLGGDLHHSRGLQITRDRLALYNRRFNLDATFDIEDQYDEAGNPSGTRVYIWFPLEEN